MSFKKIQNKGGAKFERMSQEGENYIDNKVCWIYGCVCAILLVLIIVLGVLAYPLVSKISVDVHGTDIAYILGDVGKYLLICVGFIGTGIAVNEKWPK